MDNDTPQIPFKDRNFWPALFVFTLPWLADIIILGGANQAVNGDAVRRVFDAPMGLVLNALYAAAPAARLLRRLFGQYMPLRAAPPKTQSRLFQIHMWKLWNM